MIIFAVVLAVNLSFAQSQQLKTLHHLQGKEDMTGLSYTGYEDEMGNIVRHGLFTYKKDGVSVTLNYKNGKLDGAATILHTSSKYPNWKLSCNLNYKDGKLLKINYTQNGEYNAWTGAMSSGKIVFKCSKNEQGLTVGDFECTVEGRYDNESIKGKFDDSGKATGYWTVYANWGGRQEDALHPNKASFDKLGSKVFYEKGYCLGTNENSITLGRKYFIEKSLTGQDLLNKGFFVDSNAIKVNYGIMGAGSSSGPEIENSTSYGMVSESSQRMRNVVYNTLYSGQGLQGLFVGLKDICPTLDFSCDFKEAFENVSVQGEAITFMSNELYQNIVNQIKSNNLKTTIKYDKQLKKYYVLKVDGKTRLYVPIELESNFKELNSYSKEPCPSNVTDYDGNTYNTIQIGEQCWMKENLRTTHYSDGTEIKFDYSLIPKMDDNNLISYGYLYSWQMTVNGTNGSDMLPSHIQGICPSGWHVPSDIEWQELVKVVKSQNNGNLAKSLASSSGWNYGFTGNNSTGFSALPAGKDGGQFGDNAFFWSATQDSKYTKNALCFNVSRYDGGEIGLSQGWDKEHEFSVRCVRD